MEQNNATTTDTRITYARSNGHLQNVTQSTDVDSHSRIHYWRNRLRTSKTITWQIDALRGFAILLMILDHSLMVTEQATPIRYTFTRLAMPLFFIIGGALSHRVNVKRLIPVLAVGVVLQLIDPRFQSLWLFIGYILGIVVVRYANKYLALVVCATISANNFGTFIPGYDLTMLIALVVVGSMIGKDTFVSIGNRFPKWLAPLGRYPLTIYAVHILLLIGYAKVVMQ